MQLKTITVAKDAGLPGIEFVKTDKTITEVIIGKVRIRPGNYQGITVLVEQPFEEAKRYRMTATIDGFDPKISFHDDQYSADQAARELAEKGAETAVHHVDVLIGEDGQIVGEVGQGQDVSDASDLPF